jgi:hypothetical protein
VSRRLLHERQREPSLSLSLSDARTRAGSVYSRGEHTVSRYVMHAHASAQFHAHLDARCWRSTAAGTDMCRVRARVHARVYAHASVLTYTALPNLFMWVGLHARARSHPCAFTHGTHACARVREYMGVNNILYIIYNTSRIHLRVYTKTHTHAHVYVHIYIYIYMYVCIGDPEW